MYGLLGEVGPLDTISSVLWVARQDVIAGGGEMVSLDNGERVAVRKLI